MPPAFHRTLPLVLLSLLTGACQRTAYRFQAPATLVTRAAPAAGRPDSAVSVFRPKPVETADLGPTYPLRKAAEHRPAHLFVAHSRSVRPIRMAPHQNIQAQPTQIESTARKRPLLSENQVVALMLIGGGAVLTVAGLLLIFAVGGGAAITAGILLGLLGVALVLSWFYFRALGKAYQH